MIRVTCELLPGGDPNRARTIGLVDIANVAMHGLTACPQAWEEMSIGQIAEQSVRIADALIEELER